MPVLDLNDLADLHQLRTLLDLPELANLPDLPEQRRAAEPVAQCSVAAEVAGLSARLAAAAGAVAPGMPAEGGACLELIAALEGLKCAASALQARSSVAFARSQTARQRGAVAAEAPRAISSASVAAQLGLARRESPRKAMQLLGLAKCLVEEMPHTLNALAGGQINEWRATLIVRETAVLSREHRAAVDEELAGPSNPDDPNGGPINGRIGGLGDAGVAREARRIGFRLDPGAAWKRAKKAEVERRVTIRPAPDCMTTLTAHLPVAEGVAAFAALTRAADSATAAGDTRGCGQIMADTLASRILGRTQAAPAAAGRSTAAGTAGATPSAAGVSATGTTEAGACGPATGGPIPDAFCSPAPAPAGERPSVAVEIQLIMTERALLGGGTGDCDDEPAHLAGYGPIPAPLARDIARAAATSGQRLAQPPGPDERPGPPPGRPPTSDDQGIAGEASRWLRRLYTSPATGELVAMDSRSRIFPPRLRAFLIARDRFCRTPWCEAPVRQIDHVTPVAAGGLTSASNGQGLCQTCNLAKAAPGWSASAAAGEVRTTTPTGHRYATRPPRIRR